MIRIRSGLHGVGAAVMAVLVAVSACALATGPASGAAAGPILRVSERKIDFGKVEQFQQLHHPLLLKNEGDAPLRILKIDTSCGCTAAVPADSMVAPGREVKIDVAFSTREYEGPQEKILTLTTNDPAEPIVKITVLADVKPYVKMDPTILHFEPLQRGKTASKTVRFSAEKDFGLQIGKIEGGEKHFTVTTRNESTAKEDAYVLTVAMKPDAPAGQFRALLKVQTKGKITRDFDLLATGDVVSYFVVKSDYRVRMPTTSPGKGATAKVTIAGDGSKPYKLTGVETSLPFLTGEIVPAGPGSYDVVLSVAPNAPAGDYKGKADVKTTDPAQPVINLVVMGFVRK